MIDPNLGFDPNAPGVRMVWGKPYSEHYAYVIDPYVYGEYTAPLRDLIMGQYQRVVNTVAKFRIKPSYMTVAPFNMDKFSWDLDFEAYLNGIYDCRSIPITFIDKYRPKLLILTDNELYNRVKEAVGGVIHCIYRTEMEKEEEERRKRLRTGRPLDRGPRRSKTM